MPMSHYPIRCYAPECSELAQFKIASQWSDGTIDELKTYALSCRDCVPQLLEQSRLKQAACRLGPGEVLLPPMVYLLRLGSTDHELQRISEWD